jgi:hypothetical protein
VKLEDLKDVDQLKILLPENAYLWEKIRKQHDALMLCADALGIVTRELGKTNEWPQPYLSNMGEPIVGGDIYRAVKAATDALEALRAPK